MNRWWVLLPALGATVSLLLFGGDPSSGQAVVAATVSEPNLSQAARTEGANVGGGAADSERASAAIAVRRLVDRGTLYAPDAEKWTIRDVFERRDWAPPAAQSSAAPVAAEEVPVFPYTYAGRQRQGDKSEAYLTKDNYAHIVRQGDTLDGVYRIDSISPTQLMVTHLPTRHTHSIRIGDAE